MSCERAARRFTASWISLAGALSFPTRAVTRARVFAFARQFLIAIARVHESKIESMFVRFVSEKGTDLFIKNCFKTYCINTVIIRKVPDFSHK